MFDASGKSVCGESVLISQRGFFLDNIAIDVARGREFRRYV